MRAGKRLTALASGTALAVAIVVSVAAPSFAQEAKTAAQGSAAIVVTDTNLATAYTALGAVTANVHPKSINPKTPTRDLLDAELRKEAAKLGADAVIQVRYTMRNPMMSQKGSDATGVAVKFTTVAAAPAPASPPPAASLSVASPQAQVAAAAPLPSAPAVAPVVRQTPAAPQVAQQAAPLPSPPAAAPPVAATPSAPPQQFASAAPATPAAVAPVGVPVVRHATSVDMIVLSDQEIAGRRYTRVGDVRSEVHQKSIFPKTPSKDLLNADLKAQALKLGGDAVVQLKYNMHNALTSTKGDIATGVAVRFE
ncbi:MAG: hypothetical protein ABI740_04135 [Alphaproteobacteria bacterium]